MHQAQHAFRVALCDSFNTPDALAALRDLVSRTNVYIGARGKKLDVEVVERVANWVGRMLKMFGLGEGQADELGWGEVREAGEGANVSRQKGSRVVSALMSRWDRKREETLMPYLRAMSGFRDAVRQAAMAKSDTALKDILALCDKLRDADLVPLGVALDDQEGPFIHPMHFSWPREPTPLFCRHRWKSTRKACLARGAHQGARREARGRGGEGRKKGGAG